LEVVRYVNVLIGIICVEMQNIGDCDKCYDYGHQGCDTMQCGRYIAAFLSTLLLLSSGHNITHWKVTKKI
jgi:hypothetical protein